MSAYSWEGVSGTEKVMARGTRGGGDGNAGERGREIVKGVLERGERVTCVEY